MSKILTKKENFLPKVKKSGYKPKPAKNKSPAKKKARVSLKEKSVSKKSSITKVVKKSATKEKMRSKSISKTRKKEAVDLPENMTLSAVNKSVALRKELDAYIKRSVYIVTYVAAICFILVGSTVAFSEIFGNKHSNNLLSAQITQSTTLLDSDTTETNLTSQVSIIDNIPANIIGEYRVNFIASNVSSVQARMTPLGGGQSIRLDVQRLIDDRYRTVLMSSVPSLYYTLDILYQPLNTISPRVLQSRHFFVGTEEQEYIFNNPNQTLDTSSETNEPVLNDETISETNAITNTNTNTITNTEQTNLDEQVLNTNPTTTNPAIVEPVTEINNSEINEVSPPTIDFRLEGSGTNELTGTVSIRVRAPLDFSNILLYARPTNSLAPVFVTSARIINGSWVFVFDTNNLPNNEYEFFARTTFENEVLRTTPINVRIFNITETLREEVRTTESGLNQLPNTVIREEFQDTSVVTNDLSTRSQEPPLSIRYSDTDQLREFTEINVSDFKPIITLEDRIVEATEEIMNENLADFQDLFKRYAVALQSDDEILIALAKENLVRKREMVILDTLNNERLRDMSSNLDEEMLVKIDSLKSRVETFEQIRRDRTNGDTAVDSDGDGISDFDEINLYKTDPFNPDTDNDGFNDGVEIMLGFNPNSAEPETAIVFQSPKDAKFLEQDEYLKVESVAPVITMNEDASTNSVVKAEIRGKALPNSFVTLYIFSSPTIVTVKTDADGSFVYTFDKELEDGSHEVYVAITDNTGSIIAQSKPFSFIKQAEAFEPIGTEENTVVTTTESVVSSPYNLAMGLAILSLGIILLMLGIGLRTKSELENNLIASTHNDKAQGVKVINGSSKIDNIDTDDL